MSTKPTIFFLINTMGTGGSERVLSNILPSLSKKYNIHLIVLQNTIIYDIPKNIKIHILSYNSNKFLMFLRFIEYLWKFKKLIKKYHPHKIISFLEVANFINIIANKNKAIISFRTSFFYFDKFGFMGKIYKFFIKILYPKASNIIVNSKENKIDLIKRLNLPSEKIKIIYNPIDLEKIKKLKNYSVNLPFLKKDNQRIFITIGRLDKQKNMFALIKIFKNLSSENILLIIGDGPERQNLKNLIQKYNLQKQIYLLGRQKNVYQYLNIADYFIFASKAEGFPNVLIEAMACNLPIITSDFKTGAREIIDSNLNSNKKFPYPYYGPNGVLLSLNNFEKNFEKINFTKLFQKQKGMEKFRLNPIINNWIEIIEQK